MRVPFLVLLVVWGVAYASEPAKDVEPSEPEAEDSIAVAVATWNMAAASPSAADMAFLDDLCDGSDLIAFGVQEVEPLKPRRHEGHRSREWRRLLRASLGKQWVLLGHHAMGAIQLAVYARRRVFRRCRLIKLCEVACGVGNVLQNKGAIGAFLRVDRTTFLFVAAHLAAHQENVAERNGDYWRIVGELDQCVPPAWVEHARRRRRREIQEARGQAAAAAAAVTTARSSVKTASSSAAGNAAAAAAGGTKKSRRVTVSRTAIRTMQQLRPSSEQEGVRSPAGASDHHFEAVNNVFFFGDLNYRLDLSREHVERCFREGAARPRSGGDDQSRRPTGLGFLAEFDQLTRERSRGAAFVDFCEGPLAFPPTFKYDKGTARFDSSAKRRVPSWTDRILYRPGPPLVSLLRYDYVPSARHSDHRPVVAKFRVGLSSS